MQSTSIPRPVVLVFAAALAVLLLPAAVQAAPSVKQKEWSFSVASQAEFEAQAAQVREEMGTDGRYGAISVDDRKAVESDLDLIGAILVKDSPAKLSDQQQIDIANAQERINAVLTGNDGNRLICTMERRTGTHFKEKVCIAARERDTIRRNSTDAFRDVMLQGRQPALPTNQIGTTVK